MMFRHILCICLLSHVIVLSQAFFNFAYEDYFPERCTDFWITKNVTGLRLDLEKKLFGQHVATKAVVNHLSGHIRKKEPDRALSLSFHGFTGTGKSHMSRLIAQHFYLKGMDSGFVHLIPATRDFPFPSKIEEYKGQLMSWIEGNVTSCSQSMFIFDEVDKMPVGLLDVIKPYLENHRNIAGVNYRKTIFLFISNSGGKEIIDFTYRHWKDGLPRESIGIADLESTISKTAINADKRSGFWHSDLLTKHVISSLVPFLPLMRKHLVNCTRQSLVSNNYFNDMAHIPKCIIQEVLDELTFYPEVDEVFSTSGCKRVEQKVQHVMGSGEKYNGH